MELPLSNTSNPQRILVTGANRGLGLEVIKQLQVYNPQYEIHATARDEQKLKAVFKENGISSAKTYQLDLTTVQPSALQHFVDQINPMFMVHCASPYMKKPFINVTSADMVDYTHCMLSDEILMQSFVKNSLAHHRKAVIIYTGAIIGEPHFNRRGLIGLLKSHQRHLCAIFDYELQAIAEKKINQSIYIRYLNLGSFRDEVAPESSRQFMTTQFVGSVVCDVLKSPERYPHNTCVISKVDETTYSARSSQAVQQFKENRLNKIVPSPYNKEITKQKSAVTSKTSAWIKSRKNSGVNQNYVKVGRFIFQTDYKKNNIQVLGGSPLPDEENIKFHKVARSKL